MNAAPQRWSSMTKVLRRVLEQWWPIKRTYSYTTQEFPLADLKIILEELLAILEPIQDVIVQVQAHHLPTAACAIIALAIYRLYTVNPKEPLSVSDISGPAPTSDDLPAGPNGRLHVKRDVAHADLNKVAQSTREKLRDALDNRFFNSRYGSNYWASSSTTEPPPPDEWLLDMCVLLTPSAAQLDLKYVKSIVMAMGGTIDDGEKVVKRIHDAFKARVIETAILVKGIGGEESAGGSKSSSIEGQRDIRMMNSRTSMMVDMLATLRGGGGGGGGGCSTTTRAQASLEVDRYLGQELENLPSALDYPITSSLLWWKDEGSVRFPIIALTARALLAIKASAGHIEQDFSLAGFMVSSRRSSLDSAYVDMTLFLKSLRSDEIPSYENVPKLSKEARKEAIPKRYTDEAGVKVINELDEMREELNMMRSWVPEGAGGAWDYDVMTHEQVYLPAFGENVVFDSQPEDIDVNIEGTDHGYDWGATTCEDDDIDDGDDDGDNMSDGD